MKACNARRRCGGRSQGVGIDRTGAVGQSTAPGSARLTGSTDAEDSGTDARIRRGSGEASGDTTVDDASRSRPADGTGVRVGDRNSGTVSLRQADRQLYRAGSRGEVQRRSAPTRTHQQARQRAAAVSAGGGGAGHGPQSATVAQQVLSPRHAAWTEDRESSDGAEAGGASVLDVASGLRVRPVRKVRFAGSKTQLSYCRDRGFDSIA